MNEPATYANNLPQGRPFILAKREEIAASASNSAIILKHNSGAPMVVERIVCLMDYKPWNTLGLCDIDLDRIEYTDEIDATTRAMNYGTGSLALFFGPDGILNSEKNSMAFRMRPGSELVITVTNRDTQNAVQVEFAAHGYLEERMLTP